MVTEGILGVLTCWVGTVLGMNGRLGVWSSEWKAAGPGLEGDVHVS